MVRLFVNTVLTIIGNAIGLVIAHLLIADFQINLAGFIMSVVVFTITQTILAPFVLKMAVKYLPALRGGIALVTVFVSLFITASLSRGLQINGITTWLIAPFVVWLATVIAGVLLPMVLFKKALQNSSNSDASSSK